MGVLDKFLDIMKLSDEDDYEDDLFDDEDDFDDFEEEKKSKKSFFKKEKKYDLDDEEYDDIFDDKNSGSASRMSSNNRSTNTGKTTGSKVTPMRQHGKKANMEVCVIKPTSVDDTREITETLLGGSTIILNLEGMDLEVAQRIIDFTAGSTFAIDGKLQKISNFIFLVTPTNVDISGDLQDLLNSSFEVSSIKTRY